MTSVDSNIHRGLIFHRVDWIPFFFYLLYMQQNILVPLVYYLLDIKIEGTKPDMRL